MDSFCTRLMLVLLILSTSTVPMMQTESQVSGFHSCADLANNVPNLKSLTLSCSELVHCLQRGQAIPPKCRALFPAQQQRSNSTLCLNLNGCSQRDLETPPNIADTVIPTTLVGLDLSGNGLPALPGEEVILNATSLQYLRLTSNQLKQVPRSVIRLTRLMHLHLGENEIEQIESDAFDDLPSLTNLTLSGNRLNSIHPDAFTRLTSLIFVDLSYNGLTVLPQKLLDSMPHVETLLVQHNHLSNIPLTASLEHLDASANKIHHPIIANTTQASQLKCLFLDNTELRDLAANSFAQFTGLSNLSLVNAHINSIDGHAFDGLTRLEVLLLSRNRFAKATRPKAFAGMPSLRQLDLSSCELNDLDSQVFASLTSLQDLSLASNNLNDKGTFFKALRPLTNLQQLDLSDNVFKSFQLDHLASLNKLQCLKLFDNELTEVKRIDPETCTFLCQLNFGSNQIETLSSTFFSGMTAMQRLELNTNKIQVVSLDWLSSMPNLNHLDLSFNQLRHMAALDNTTNLTALLLNANSIKQLSHLGSPPLSNLQTLGLDNNEITQLPQDFLFHMTSLEKLYLSSNQIQTLEPTTFAQQSKLKILAFHSNRITELANGTLFRSLSKITWLNFSNNRLHKLSSRLFSRLQSLEELLLDTNQLSGFATNQFNGLRNLKSLSAKNNKIRSLSVDAFEGLEQLEEVDLSSNEITTLEPGVFSKLAKLTAISFAHNHIESVSSAALSSLKSLRYLDMSKNFLPFLPERLLEASGRLEYLNVSFNQLDAVDDQLLRNATELAILDLSNNRISDLSVDVFAKAALLRHLNLSHNKLELMPDNIFRSQRYLQTLQLRNCELTGLDSSLLLHQTQLKFLDLASNKIRYVPVEVLSYTLGLADLDLSGNRLCSIDADVFRYTTQLQVLNLSNNGLHSLASSAFLRVAQLVSLDMSCNKLDEIDSGWFSSLSLLQQLYLKRNDIQTIPSGAFTKAEALTLIDISHNELERLENDAFAELHHLEELRLSNNPLQVVDKGSLHGLTRLKTLDLSNCHLTEWNAEAFNLQQARSLQLLRLSNNTLASVISKGPSSRNGRGKGVLVDLHKTSLVNPRELNHMGLPGPLFILPGHAKVRCTTSYADGNLETTCTCFHPYKNINGKCVDQTPAFVAGGVVSGIGLGLAVAVAFTYVSRQARRRRKRLAHDLETQRLLVSEKEQDIQALRSAWQIDPAELSFDTMLGQGAFGEIWKVSWLDTPVAAKVLNQAIAELDDQAVEEFKGEVEFLMRCRHPNIVRFFGAGTRQGLPFLVMEYVPRGSLKDYVRDLAQPLTWQMRVRFAREIAAGLGHIHSLGQMHRDVKTDNVLLDSQLMCKVADFGTVKQIVKAGTERRRTMAQSFIAYRRHDASFETFFEDGETRRGSSTSVLSRVTAFVKKRWSASRPTSILGTEAMVLEDKERSRSAIASSWAVRRRTMAWDWHTKPKAHSLRQPLLSEDDSLSAEDVFSVDWMSTSDDDKRRSVSMELTSGKGTPLYMAPEVIGGTRYGFSADVYSFGVVMWEIAARRVPDLLEECDAERASAGGPYMSRLQAALDEGVRLPVPGRDSQARQRQRPDASAEDNLLLEHDRPRSRPWPEAYVSLMQQCWQQAPTLRPSFAMIVTAFSGVIADEYDDVEESTSPPDFDTITSDELKETPC